MVTRIRTLNTLANEVEPSDQASAAVLRELVSKRVERLAALEHASLARRFDPAAPFVFAFFVLPAGIASYFAWTRSGWWTWPVLLISGGWTAIVFAAGWSQFWKEREEIAEAEQAS
jgi:hypothetical protein